MKTKFSDVLADAYLDYFKNYVSLEHWAKDNDMSKRQAGEVLRVGANLNEERWRASDMLKAKAKVEVGR